MPLTVTSLPFGLREIYLYPLTGDTPGTGVRLPVSRTLSFSESADSEELRGDDGLTAVHDTAPKVDWDLEAGGVPLEAIRTMYGGAIVESGITPSQKKVYNKRDTDARPYFMCVGRAISDSGGDFTVNLFKCKATGELSGELADGSFWLSGASGSGLARGTNRDLYEFVQNETATALSATAPSPATRV